MNVKFSVVRPFFRQQIVYLALSAVLIAMLWAMGVRANPGPVVVFTLCVGNLLSPAISRVEFLYSGRPFPFNWLIFVPVLLVLTVPVYLIST
ncbi:MAG: hypothetical protein ABR860_14715, partial [Terracidiphilus sp.]